MSDPFEQRFIAGAKGGGKDGGGAAKTPVEAPDSLRSDQHVRIIDAICEGEIQGLVNGLKSVYLNGTPIQNADNSYNFAGVVLDTRNGTQSQSAIAGFPDTENEIATGDEVRSSSPVVHSISNANVDAARVTLQFPSLTDLDISTGNLNGTSVTFSIALQSNGGGYATVKTDTVSGKCTTPYYRAYRIELTGSAPWDIRVTKTTADSTRASLSNKVFWASYAEIIDGGLSYPNTALVGLQIDARQFTSIPTRGYDCKLLRVQIPTNYNPTTRVYTGTWDGMFQIAWTDNPAWCFRDLVLSPRYGIGQFVVDAQLDKWALYAIAQYCDELVSDGKGGQEPRFTCNLYLQTAAEAYTVLQNFASIFRGILYWAAGALVPVADRPNDPVYQFNQTNVAGGNFTYQGSSRRGRHTVALISWNDPGDFYAQKIEYVPDDAGIARYGVQKTAVVALGCTSRGQAHRLGLWLLLTERLETETVSFRAGIEGTYVHPGVIVQVHDPNRAGVRFGGRVVNASTSLVTIDAPVTLAVGHAYTLSCQMPDGTLSTKAVVNPGTGSPQSSITMAAAFAQAPHAQSVWVLEADNLAATNWRVLSVRETAPNEYEISALYNDQSKYAAVEGGIILQSPPTSFLPDVFSPDAPTALTWTQSAITTGDAMQRVLDIGWSAPAASQVNVIGYIVEWQFANGELNRSRQFSETHYRVPATPGLYTARVWAVGNNGLLSDVLTGTYLVTADAPYAIAKVTGLEIYGQDNDLQFTTPDAIFAWRYNATASSFDLGSEPQGGNSGGMDLIFKDFEITIYDAISGVPLRVEHTTDPHWTYTQFENAEDSNGAARRAFIVGVAVRDRFARTGPSAYLSVSNPAPRAPTVTLYALAYGVRVFADVYPDPDIVGMRVWMNTISPVTLVDANIAYDGKDFDHAILGLLANTPYYFRVAIYDTFGKAALNVAAESSIQPTGISATGGIAVVGSLPSPVPGDGVVVYLTADGKLYRSRAGLWVTWASAADIQGQLVDSQIAAMAASKLSGQLVAGQLATGSVAALTIQAGAVTAAAIAAGSIGAAAIQAGSITSDKLSVAQLSTISANMGTIAAGNVTLDAGGFIRGGQTGYNTGSGFWLGYATGYKFSIGNPAGQNMTWDGSALKINGVVAGTITNFVSAASDTQQTLVTPSTVLDGTWVATTVLSAAITITAGSKILVCASIMIAPTGMNYWDWGLYMDNEAGRQWDTAVNGISDLQVQQRTASVTLVVTPGAAGAHTFFVKAGVNGGSMKVTNVRLFLQEIRT